LPRATNLNQQKEQNKVSKLLSTKYLHELFEYRDGRLYRKVARANAKVGEEAGHVNTVGYRVVTLDGKIRLVHRLIYQMVHGDCPEFLDHINGVRTDNRIENLRPANKSQNSANQKLSCTNTTGIKNVSFDKKNSSYFVTVRRQDKHIFCGRFKDIELAELVAIEARDKYHGKYARQF
jgi:hypothetical protein